MGLALTIQLIPDPIAAHKGYHCEQHKLFQSVQGGDMDILDVEPA
jgi:hypothetical protein